MSNDEQQNDFDNISLIVADDCESVRLDKFLGNNEEVELSRTRIRKLIDDSLILVNGEPAFAKFVLKGGEKIEIKVPPAVKTDLIAEDIPLDIVYDDEHLAVINKAAGMVTHPGIGNHSGTLVNALLFNFNQLSAGSSSERPGIVHRLDKETSGLLVVAKDDKTYQVLQSAIQSRELKREYLALIWGHMTQEEGVINLPIGRSTRNRKMMAVTSVSSKEAITNYKLLERYRSYELIDISLQTGRTHQIRVHLSHLGHPVFGDKEYGGREKQLLGLFGPERPLAKRLLALIDRQSLHAIRLSFIHPINGEEMKFEAPIPEDFTILLDMIRSEGA